MYWILNGKGTFPKSENTSNYFEEVKSASIETPFIQTELESPDLFSATASKNFEKEIQPTEINHHTPTANTSGTIERIVIFYKDGTFKNYMP